MPLTSQEFIFSAVAKHTKNKLVLKALKSLYSQLILKVINIHDKTH